MSFAVGSLVRARNREWVVLPESEPDLLVLRPLGGTDDDITGICTMLEQVESAHFNLPDPAFIGDNRSCRLLREAVRLGFRSSAGPFRSFGRINVEPRPYQLVPLLVALKLDPIRVLIADDVGIGKTIEACLIARELLDRGEIKRIAVICPPHLADQWQAELLKKFNINAELVLPGTVRKLEQHCGIGQTLFDIYPHVVVSMDFIKSEKHRNDFLRTCPEFVIVDEAHTCSYGQGLKGGGRHQRHQLIKGLADNRERHIILVTATPHSGKDEAFRSLLSLLNPEFADLPEDLSGQQNEHHRRQLAAHLVQRTRADIRHFLTEDTPFPDRIDLESGNTYTLSEPYRKLFDKAIEFTREAVGETEGNQYRRRVKWWSALALLRSLASSPAAAAATLRSRAIKSEADSAEEADELGRRLVLDLEDSETIEALDVTPGCDDEALESMETPGRRRLLEMAREADSLKGENDVKLKKAIGLVKTLLAENCRPILFCRFIDTAEYVAAELRKAMPKDVEIMAVTGILPPAEREERVAQLASAPKHILVCTDCLSEGINLQKDFDTVVHYDLSWSPTRHEQRAGRVDRYGQPCKKVRVITYWGTDNRIDGIVLDVLLQKQKKIRSSLGITVPVPANTNDVIEAIFEGLLLREQSSRSPIQLDFLDQLGDFYQTKRNKFHEQWQSLAEKEKRSRTMFAQETIKPDDVAVEMKAARDAVGSWVNVGNFVLDVCKTSGAAVTEKNDWAEVDTSDVAAPLCEAIGSEYIKKNLKISFKNQVEKSVYLHRTHPLVEGLATYIMDSALDEQSGTSVARRCGVIRTDAVQKRTTVLLVRLRYHILRAASGLEQALLAEDCLTAAFSGPPEAAEWLNQEATEKLLQAEPRANITPDVARGFIQKVIEGSDRINPYLNELATSHGNELLEAHQRVRKASRMTGVSYKIEPKLPPDVLGVYVYLPVQ